MTLPSGNDIWGVASFKKLPRASAFARVFLFLTASLAISYFSVAFKGQNFALDILTKLDCLLAVLLLYTEGTHVKHWFIKRFTWPANNRALIVGLFLTTMSITAAAMGHYLVAGQLPVIEDLPFSGHIFGYFLINLFLASFEDISWRAFLLPRVLHLIPCFGSILGIGALWGIWHIGFYLTLDLVTPNYVVTPVIYYTFAYIPYYIVWRLSAGSMLPLTITHAFYNTVVHFTTERILFLEGKSDIWLFYHCQIIALGILSCAAAFIIKRFKFSFDFSLNKI